MRLRPGLARMGLLAFLFAGTSGCDHRGKLALAKAPVEQDKAAPKPALKAPAVAAAAADPGLTDAMRADLGAAAWIPEDAAYFSSTLRLKEQWKSVVESRAFKKVLILPFVQLALGQVRQHPAYREFFEEAARNPLLASALEVATDAASSEIFVYADAQLVSFLRAAGDVYINGLLEGVVAASAGGRPGAPSPLPAIIAEVLRHEKDLRLPPVIFGFRLTHPDAARSLLASTLEKLKGSLPAPVEMEEAGGGKFQTLRLGFGLVPPAVRDGITSALRGEGVEDDDIEKLNGFLDSQTLALSVGLRGDYLFLSVGPSTEHLKKLGQGRSLAESAVFAPVRRHLKAGLISLSYLAASLTMTGKEPVDKWLNFLDRILGHAQPGDLPDGLAPRLKKDVRSFLEDCNHFLPEAAPCVSLSFFNHGMESYSFSAPGSSGLNATKPLSILSRAGASPMLAIATRSAPSLEAYDHLTRWVQVAYGYFEDFVVPRIPEGERKEVERFQRLFVPTIKELHETTKNLLLPAIDGSQDLLTLDGGGIISALPDKAGPLPRPLKYPRPVLALELSDAAKLKEAFARYRETLNHFFRDAERELKFSHVEIPEPTARPHAGGTLYTYPLPASPGPDFEPHALVSGSLVILALSPAQSKDVVESSTTAHDDVVDLSAAAGMVYRVDLSALSRLVFEDLGVIVGELVERRMLPQQGAGMIRLHLPEIEKALSALKSFSGRVYDEGGLEVHHSWLHVEDLADD